MKYYGASFVIKETNTALNGLGFQSNNKIGWSIYFFLILVGLVFLLLSLVSIWRQAFPPSYTDHGSYEVLEKMLSATSTNPSPQINNYTPSINTFNQTGGVNTINIISTSTVEQKNFHFSNAVGYPLRGGRYGVAYKITPLTKTKQALIYLVKTDNQTNAIGAFLVQNGEVIRKDTSFVKVSLDEYRIAWQGAYLEVPPTDLLLEIIFDKEPKSYSFSTSF